MYVCVSMYMCVVIYVCMYIFMYMYGWGEIFFTHPEWPWGSTSPLYNEYRVFPGGKAAGAWPWPPTPSSAEVKERVQLYLYSPSGISWPLIGWNCKFTFTFTFTCMNGWMVVCLCVCVCTIHIYAFLLYRGAVFYGSGTFVLRSTAGYLALYGIKYDLNRTLSFQHSVLNYRIVSVVASEQTTVHTMLLLLGVSQSIIAIIATSVSLLLATIQ